MYFSFFTISYRHHCFYEALADYISTKRGQTLDEVDKTAILGILATKGCDCTKEYVDLINTIINKAEYCPSMKGFINNERMFNILGI